MNTLDIDTGKLSFHIRTLSPFIEQTKTGKYKLSPAGEDAVRVIKDVESWAEMSTMDRKTPQLPLASYRQRIYAFLTDYAIMMLLSLPLLLVWLLEPGFSWIISTVNLLFVAIAFQSIYSTILEGFSGQTLGKRVTGLFVIRIDGKKVGYEHAAVRNLGKVLLPFDLILGFILNDPRFIRYFDKFAGTTVITLRKKSKPQENVNSILKTEDKEETREQVPPIPLERTEV
jgi:uncharacterized RDD family membrane protein YckC